jgi:hypothetical protein
MKFPTFVLSLVLVTTVSLALNPRQGNAQEIKGIDSALLAKATAGDAASEFLVGYAYGSGKSVPLDYAQAAVWFRKAAEQGNADGQTALAVLYDYGHGVPQDYTQAIFWDRKAADQGDATMRRLPIGSGKRRTRDWRLRRSTWRDSTRAARAFRRTIHKQ